MSTHKDKEIFFLKSTRTRATKARERLFKDSCGPYPRSIGGSKYWFKVVDDYSRKNWNYSMKRKSEESSHSEVILIKNFYVCHLSNFNS